MATNFPSSKQSQPSVPSPGDKLSSPNHLDDTTTLWDTLEAVQDQLLSGTYRANTEPVTVPVGSLEVRSGATKTNTNSTPVYSFAAGANQAIYGQADLPSNWNTVEYEIVWTNLGTDTANDVSWRPDINFDGDGDTIGPPTSGTAQLVTPPAQNVRKYSTLRTFTNVPGDFLDFTLFRLGASDSMSNAAGIQAIRFRPVTFV